MLFYNAHIINKFLSNKVICSILNDARLIAFWPASKSAFKPCNMLAMKKVIEHTLLESDKTKFEKAFQLHNIIKTRVFVIIAQRLHLNANTRFRTLLNRFGRRIYAEKQDNNYY